ncbi:MAG TPA: hypothetical protein VKS80_11800, partial [Trinickia sp.]|nr:hypothetical protein [Trinickia sp.]
ISVAGPGHADAVGAYALTSGNAHALALVLSGTPATWKNVPISTPGVASALAGVSQFSGGAFLAGLYGTSAGSTFNIAGKLVGTTYTALHPPNLGAAQNKLTAVLSLSSTQAIFVGDYTDSIGFAQNYAELWNGTGFMNLNPPGQGGRFAGTNSIFTAVRAVPGTSHIDFAGYRACPVDTFCPFVYVYNMATKTWSSVDTAVTPSVSGQVFNGFHAQSSIQAWAVGAYQDSANNTFAMIQRFDDATLGFKNFTLPSLPAESILDDVAALATNDAVAVGVSGNTKPTTKPIALYWNGTVWAKTTPIVTIPTAFYGISEVPGSTNGYIVVGAQQPGTVSKTLAAAAACD